MKTKFKVAIIAGAIIGLVSITIPTVFFLIQPPEITNGNNDKSIDNVIYPNPLFYRGTISDMMLESDDRVQFIVGSYNATYVTYPHSPAYIILDHKNQTCTYKEMFPGIMSGNMHQLKIGLGPNNESIAYNFFTNPFGYLVAYLYKTNTLGRWIFYPALSDKPIPYGGFNRRSVYNWNFMPSGKINLAFLYQGTYNTPAIYNETTDSFFFLYDVFEEIQDQVILNWYGDFAVVDSNIFYFWLEYINEFNFHPYLAIKWQGEGWQLTRIGNESETYMPISIIPQNNKVNIFYHDSGISSFDSRLYHTQIYNSTSNTTTLLHQFDGRTVFRQDSVCALSQNEYVFIYTKGSYELNAQRDLFMGYYDGKEFYEFMLTNTTQYHEHRAHCELGENYIHLAWETAVYKGTGTYDPLKNNLFYNRISLREIRLSKETGKIPSMITIKNEHHRTELFNDWAFLKLTIYIALSIRISFFPVKFLCEIQWII